MSKIDDYRKAKEEERVLQKAAKDAGSRVNDFAFRASQCVAKSCLIELKSGNVGLYINGGHYSIKDAGRLLAWLQDLGVEPVKEGSAS